MTHAKRIEEFIREHRDRLTREAIIQQLESSGYARPDIDAAWERVASAEPFAGRQRGALATYVWVVYWLGAALIVLYAIYVTVAGSGGGFFGFATGWLLLYLAIAFLPARVLARSRPSSLAAIIGIVVAAPLIVLVIGGGICAATVAIILRSMG
ncbi:MAG: hypothetical protein ACRDFY_09575, partial [Candidatus Limnocylindria bacterium]